LMPPAVSSVGLSDMIANVASIERPARTCCTTVKLMSVASRQEIIS
jgi:hypothetical protein